MEAARNLRGREKCSDTDFAFSASIESPLEMRAVRQTSQCVVICLA
jgi:hypothetical protein